MKIIEQQKKFMNTIITIKVVQDEQKTVEILDAVEAAFGEFDRIVKLYTRFDEKSELSNLNRQSGKWINVSQEFIFLIEYMFDLANKTEGAFDPTIIDFLEIYGYDKNYDFSKLENSKLDRIVQKRIKERPSYKEFEMDKENLKVKLAPNQRIDLGGVGKGYAIDCAYEKLKDFKNLLIDAGGDIRANGKNLNGENWVVDMLDQNFEGKRIVVGQLELFNESLACSGSWGRKFKQFHHLINPRNGKPENARRTVFIKAPTALESDSWATAVFIGGSNVIEVMPKNFAHFVL